MKENLYSLLVSFPGKEHVEKVCKIGQGEKTCRYLVISSGKGFECSKASSLRQTIDRRFAGGTMNAKGDNCGGLLGVIIENQEILKGRKIQYKESMPTYETEGTLENIQVEKEILGINGNWSNSENRDVAIAIDALEISVNMTNITFGLAGLGAFGGRTTIFF